MKKFIFVLLLCSCTEHLAERQAFDPQLAAALRVKLGLAYLARGDLQRARRDLLQAQRYAPDGQQVMLALGRYYQAVKELPRAQLVYARLIELYPEQAAVLRAYGQFLCRQAQYQQAKQYFQRAFELNDVNIARSHELYAICLMAQHKEEDAVIQIGKAHLYDPNNLEISQQMRYIQAACRKGGSARCD